MPRTRSTAKPERLEARITRDQKDLFQRAANLTGRTLTDFIVSSVQQAAEQAVRTHQVLELTARDTEVLVEALTRPPEPNARLHEYARRRRDLLGE